LLYEATYAYVYEMSFLTEDHAKQMRKVDQAIRNTDFEDESGLPVGLAGFGIPSADQLVEE